MGAHADSGSAQYVQRRGVTLAFVDFGRGAPPILFIHDLGNDRTCFAAHVSHFQFNH